MNTTTTHGVIKALIETLVEIDPEAAERLANRLDSVKQRAHVSNWSPDVAEVTELINTARK